MKTEDIDKRISMPDVDAEWARFEREVIDKDANAGRRSVYSWIGGVAIAASVVIVAGLFFLNRNPKETEQILSPLDNNKDIPYNKLGFTGNWRNDGRIITHLNLV